MKSNSWRVTLAQILLGGAIVLAIFVVRGVQAGNQKVHLVTDWSHRHLMFSPPRSLVQQFRLSQNTRYVQQWLRRAAEQQNNGRGRNQKETGTIAKDWSVDLGSGATVGAGQFPAKYSFDVTTATCASEAGPDFVVFNTSRAPSVPFASPTIVAFDNLYSGCSGTVPSVYWAYATGGTAVTSVAMSLDGTQVVYVQNVSGAAQLVLLKWKAAEGTIAGPVSLTSLASGADYQACTATTTACMLAIPFAADGTYSSTADTNSPVFYDYDHDTAYVGDNNGYLHQFTGVFNGAPAENVIDTSAAVWPAQVTPSAAILTGPIYDDALSSPQIFVASSSGFLYRVDATIGSGAGGIVTSVQMAATGFGIDDTPMLDASGSALIAGQTTQGLVYVYVRKDNGTYNGPGIFDIAANFGAGTSGLEANVSTDGTPPAGEFFTGNLDNAYWTTGSGHLYGCSTHGQAAALWQAALNNSQDLGVPAYGPSLTSSNVQCSPITEFYNASLGADYIFVSTTADPSVGGNCLSATAGCIMSFDVTSGSWGTAISPSATAAVNGGASGVVVDNDSTAIGGSQIYFTPLANQACGGASDGSGTGTGGCAIQASQAALQ